MANTQTKQIYDYMMKHGSITQADAIRLGIYRLASRIWDLKAAGVHIITSSEEVHKADGTKTRVARYALVKDSLSHVKV